MMTINTFKATYNLSATTNLYSYNFSNKAIQKNIIDETYILKRKKFQRKIWMKSHDYYFYLNEAFTDLELSYFLADYTSEDARKWQYFMRDYLFAVQPLSVTDFHVSGNLWMFFRFTRMLIGRILKAKRICRAKLDSTVGFILDKRVA